MATQPQRKPAGQTVAAVTPPLATFYWTPYVCPDCGTTSATLDGTSIGVERDDDDHLWRVWSDGVEFSETYETMDAAQYAAVKYYMTRGL